MALVQDNLYNCDDLAPIQAVDYIRKLVVGLAAGYTSVECPPVFDMAIDQVALTRDTAAPLGLILNELVTNCFKHAFRGVVNPTLSVRLRRTDESRLELVVADNGTGMAEGLEVNPPRSFGLDLVRTLVGQLGGTLELDRTDGTRFRITCPYPAESPGEAV